MAETKARFLANLIGADNTANDFTLPNTAVSGTDNKVLTSGGDGTVTWEQTEISPETTSISPTEVASSAGGNITFTLTGTNYALSGMAVHFIATSGSDITSGMTVTHTSATSLSVEIARSAFVDANEPYSVKVTKASGLTHTLSDALRVDNAPSFTASANTVVATVQEGASNATHATIVATDAEGDTITFSEVGTTLYNEFTSATPRGVQSDGAIKGVPDVVTTESQETTFTVRATSTGDGGATTKTTDQAFKFVITPPPMLFAGKTYTGNGTSISPTFDETYSDDTTARNFQPDLVWLKNRDNASHSHQLFDSVRGATNRIYSNANTAQGTDSQVLTAFNSDGFSIGSNIGINGNNEAHIAWAWKAGGAPSGTLAGSGATASLTNGVGNGTIHNSATGVSNATSITQSVNQNSGFSITKYTGTAADNTLAIPHNLGGTPDVVLIKPLAANDWYMWHSGLGSSGTAGNFIALNGSQQKGYNAGGSSITNRDIWGSGHDSTVMRFKSSGSNGYLVNYAGDFIVYAWKAVSGVSAFGSYTANGTSPKVVTGLGFKPRFLMVKCYDTANLSWHIVDTFRFGGDTGNEHLYADLSQAELDTSSHATTFDNDGFTLTGNSAHMNDGSKNYIYMAFA